METNPDGDLLDSGLQSFTIAGDSRTQPVRFYGTELAHVDRGGCHYHLYKTQGNQYVCQHWRHGASRAAAVRDGKGVMDFFGFDDLSLDLYRRAGIEYIRDIA